ncbi:MAG: hypothetical protein HY540_05815 [Deltaproteobacteria bacterium]|nr:hypothetical protein [Deltaproteobacteria bacterium]
MKNDDLLCYCSLTVLTYCQSTLRPFVRSCLASRHFCSVRNHTSDFQVATA